MVGPSRKIVYIGIAAAVAIGAISVAYFYNPNSPKTSTSDGKAAVVAVSNALVNSDEYNQDSDNDGLKDWEETLWGTDPHNSDTDGDGTSDGDEVKAGRNPLKKGPNDLLNKGTTAQIAATATSTNQSDDTLTATQKFSRDLFASYMSLKQAGKELTPELEAEMIQSFLVRSAIASPQKTIFVQTDFRINTDESPTTLKAYGNTMGQILINDAPKGMSELGALEQAIVYDNDKALDQIDVSLKAYTKMLADFRTVRVPTSFAEMHAELATQLAAIISSLQNIKKISVDPVMVMGALDDLQQTIYDNETTFADISNKFGQLGIKYGQNEPGFRFANANT